jgi:hypothetical protein
MEHSGCRVKEKGRGQQWKRGIAPRFATQPAGKSLHGAVRVLAPSREFGTLVTR